MKEDGPSRMQKLTNRVERQDMARKNPEVTGRTTRDRTLANNGANGSGTVE